MKNYVKNNIQAIEEYLNSLNSNDLISTWNEYAREHNSDNEIYNNDDEFFEVYFSKPLDAIRAVLYGDYNYSHEYVKFNGCENLETTNSPEDWIDISELAEAIFNYPQDFYDIELEDDEEETEEK